MQQYQLPNGTVLEVDGKEVKIKTFNGSVLEEYSFKGHFETIRFVRKILRDSAIV